MISADSYRVLGQGEPVLMLHSSMSSKGQWKELSQRFSEHYQVITLDLLGYGGADFPERTADFSLQDEAEWIDAVLDHAGITADRPLHVVGHSYGGATALYWCCHQQDRVKSLHLFEPVAFQLLHSESEGYANVKAVVDRLDVLMAEGHQMQACRHFIDYWSGTGAFDSFPAHLQESMVAQVPKVVLDFKALMETSLGLADYTRLEMPKTLIKGTESPVSSREIALMLRDSLKNVDFHEINCGHMGPITHSEQVNDILIRAFKL